MPTKSSIGFCQSISLTPVSLYFDNIKKQGWGFNSVDMDNLAIELHDHVNTSLVSSVSIWLKGSFTYNWEETIKWVKSSVESLKHYNLKSDIFLSNMKPLTTSSNIQRSESSVEAINLRLKPVYSPINGINLVISGFHKKCTPLQILQFFALNPQVFVGMLDGKIPISLN